VVLNMLLTGLAEAATNLVAEESTWPTCGLRCMWPGILVLVTIGMYVLGLLAVILHFYAYHRRKLWQPYSPETTTEVEDPILRNFFRFEYDYLPRGLPRVSACCRAVTRMVSRMRGSFEMLDEETKEPARTERLLAHPFALTHSVASDGFSSISQMVLGRSSGGGIIGVTYDWIALVIQLALAVLLGLGSVLEWGSSAAFQQIVIVIVLQFGLALFLFLCAPGIDRFECFVTAAQFFVEGLGTALFLAATEEAAMLAFTLALASIFIPVVLNLYDSLIVPVIMRMRSHESVSCTTWLCTLFTVLFSVPATVMAVMGIQCRAFDMCLSMSEEGIGQGAGASEEAKENAKRKSLMRSIAVAPPGV